ncbi:BMP family lipoprotein [Haloplasma contractile]|uniref:CD4+ T-cell-stimulating antigen protein n=1 Tax=Haloplasma contractile SSD-17B TaxID=1033810 RepID=U2EGF6_9MOLU|nr:BMP family ABC transporter substrate-binding protein [Haloplasma contractile]ERJ13696.1 CD4+ T-cell-stimulating antigen protein [Haloplasma contractile SSD-17B]
MKKILSIFSVLTLTFLISACGTQVDDSKVGMVTDSGTISDKSFNQGSWEGIKRYEEENAGTDNAITTKYLQPQGEAKTDYLSSIQNLVDAGYGVIVTPGFKFETAIYEAQDLHEDVKFILIDGEPHNQDYSDFKTNDNVINILFAEHQAGFLAGVSAALETETGKVGFIGGMEIPPVQKFGYGYVAGVAYANDKYNLDVKVVDYIYQGTFDDVAAGQNLASGMYAKGIDIIFHAAGGVGVGVFNEAKDRATNGENVYVIGVDINQYDEGMLADGSKSVTLTSALKRIDVASHDYVAKVQEGTFEGGQTVRMDITNDGVGLPAENPNLADDTETKVAAAKQDMIDGDYTVPATGEELETFLTEYGYTSPDGVSY